MFELFLLCVVKFVCFFSCISKETVLPVLFNGGFYCFFNQFVRFQFESGFHSRKYGISCGGEEKSVRS